MRNVTPETNALILADAHSGIDDYMTDSAYGRMADLCADMEKARDEARTAATIFREMAEQTFGTMTFPRRFPWENAKADRP